MTGFRKSAPGQERRVMFHLSFGSPGLDAIVGAAAALILIPADIARRRRNRRR